MSWFEKQNPNKVTRKHFELAIKLADKCKPERPEKIAPKVGAVVVKDGKVITESHRNQTGSGDHAEFIAFEQRGIDKVDFIGADLITTLEPCTEKRHGKEKKACADWVRLRRIRKVWIGVLDRNPHIRGKAVMMLHDRGIHVGWFPDDLTQRILEQNKDFFEYTKLMTPHLSAEDLEERRIEIRDLVQHELASYKNDFNSMKNLLLNPAIPGPVMSVSEFTHQDDYDRDRIMRFAQVPLAMFQEGLSNLMTLDIHNGRDWIRIGGKLLLAHEIGLVLFKGSERLEKIESDEFQILLKEDTHFDSKTAILPRLIEEPPGIASAGRAFDTAVKLDGTNVDAVTGLVTVELLIGEDLRAFEVLETSRKYLATPNDKISNLYTEVGKGLRKSGNTKWRLSYTRAKDFKQNY